MKNFNSNLDSEDQTATIYDTPNPYEKVQHQSLNGKRRVFDCFLYLDEEILLELRLNTLVDVVDYFVIVESTRTIKG